MTAPETSSAPALTPDEVITSQRKRQIVIMSVVIAVLAGLIIITRIASPGETRLEPVPLAGGTTTEPASKGEDVGQIELWRGQDKPLILRREGAGWRVPARFGAPADSAAIDSLVSRVLSSNRLGRPSTTDSARYVLYELGEDEAVHLKLSDAGGKELLHLMLGRSTDGARDFVRLAGADAPEGIFELTGAGGPFDNLYSRLNLTSEGKLDAARWLDLSGFRVIEPGTRVDVIRVQDGARTQEFRRDPLEEKKWTITQPGSMEGEDSPIQAIVGALEHLSALDVAGPETDAARLGILESRRTVTLEYLKDGQPAEVTIAFGNTEDSRVAAHVKDAGRGSMIHWVADYVLNRVFRGTSEYARKLELGAVPIGVQPTHILLRNGEKIMEARKGEGADWKLLQPPAFKADRMAISTLLVSLNTLRGARMPGSGEQSIVDPEKSTRWLELRWTETVGEASSEKTASLHFGQAVQGDVPVLVRPAGGEPQVYWLPESSLEPLFTDPADFVGEVKVRHVLITWKGKSDRAQPKDPERTEQQAREMVAAIMKRAIDGEDFVKLQVEFSEDSTADVEYNVARNGNFVPEFTDLSMRLPVGGVDQCETAFGIHIIKRIE